jgi:hypothetical protein
MYEMVLARQRENVQTALHCPFSDRDYVVLQVMLEESFHCITAGYAV